MKTYEAWINVDIQSGVPGYSRGASYGQQKFQNGSTVARQADTRTDLDSDSVQIRFQIQIFKKQDNDTLKVKTIWVCAVMPPLRTVPPVRMDPGQHPAGNTHDTCANIHRHVLNFRGISASK